MAGIAPNPAMMARRVSIPFSIALIRFETYVAFDPVTRRPLVTVSRPGVITKASRLNLRLTLRGLKNHEMRRFQQV
jgi:hypothetical protein